MVRAEHHRWPAGLTAARRADGNFSMAAWPDPPGMLDYRPFQKVQYRKSFDWTSPASRRQGRPALDAAAMDGGAQHGPRGRPLRRRRISRARIAFNSAVRAIISDCISSIRRF